MAFKVSVTVFLACLLLANAKTIAKRDLLVNGWGYPAGAAVATERVSHSASHGIAGHAAAINGISSAYGINGLAAIGAAPVASEVVRKTESVSAGPGGIYGAGLGAISAYDAAYGLGPLAAPLAPAGAIIAEKSVTYNSILQPALASVARSLNIAYDAGYITGVRAARSEIISTSTVRSNLAPAVVAPAIAPAASIRESKTVTSNVAAGPALAAPGLAYGGYAADLAAYGAYGAAPLGAYSLAGPAGLAANSITQRSVKTSTVDNGALAYGAGWAAAAAPGWVGAAPAVNTVTESRSSSLAPALAARGINGYAYGPALLAAPGASRTSVQTISSSAAPGGYLAAGPAGYLAAGPAGYLAAAPAGYLAAAPAGYLAAAPAGYLAAAHGGYLAAAPAGYLAAVGPAGSRTSSVQTISSSAAAPGYIAAAAPAYLGAAAIAPAGYGTVSKTVKSQTVGAAHPVLY